MCFVSNFFNMITNFGDLRSKIAMLGLDAAGKTTILYKLKINENVTTIPKGG